MNKLVWFDGTDFAIRDPKGVLRYPAPDELSKYASKTEIAEAIHRFEASQMPLPSFDPVTGLYYWDDPSDQWPEEDVLDDINKLWPGMDAKLLLLSARLMAALGIKD